MELNATTTVELCRDMRYGVKYNNAKNRNAIKLCFAYREISRVAANSFHEFKLLQVLNLEDNHLTIVPKGLFDSLTELRDINLLGNKIKEFVDSEIFRHNKRLESINISSNEIETLDARVFADLPELKKLDFRYNKLQTFDFKCLEKSRKLEELCFSGNSFIAINQLNNFRVLFPLLKLCYLNENQFSCSYMQSVILSLKEQNINIFGFNEGSGVHDNCVYGIGCISDAEFNIVKESRAMEQRMLVESLSSESGKTQRLDELKTEIGLLKLERQNNENRIAALLGEIKVLQDMVQEEKAATEDKIQTLINQRASENEESKNESEKLKRVIFAMQNLAQQDRKDSDEKFKILINRIASDKDEYRKELSRVIEVNNKLQVQAQEDKREYENKLEKLISVIKAMQDMAREEKLLSDEQMKKLDNTMKVMQDNVEDSWCHIEELRAGTSLTETAIETLIKDMMFMQKDKRIAAEGEIKNLWKKLDEIQRHIADIRTMAAHGN